jgi:hypothetical protein
MRRFSRTDARRPPRPAAGRACCAGLVALLVGGCARASATVSPSGPAAARARKAVPAPRLVTPARLFVVPEQLEGEPYAVEPDGTRKLIVQGMRLVQHADGSIERAQQIFAASQKVAALELPARFSGGYLFYASRSDYTLIWRAKSWTAQLQPFAHLDFEVLTIVAGFERLYAFEEHYRQMVSLDPGTGAATDTGALPPSPEYGRMGFVDAWLAAVQLPFRGTLVTFDAGATWQPLGTEVGDELGVEEGQVVIGDQVLDASGRLRLKSSGSQTDQLFRGAGRTSATQDYLALQEDEAVDQGGPEPPPPGPLGRRALQLAALYGFPDSSQTAIVAAGGVLARVRLRDGKLLDVGQNAYPADAVCHAVPLGEGAGFVCGSERGKTTLYAFSPPLSLRAVLSFDEPRYVSSSGNGALVIRGSCRSDADAAEQLDSYCIRTRAGRLRSIRVTGDRGVERLVALRDGRVAVLIPPRRAAPGLLTLVDAEDSRTHSVKLKFPKTDAPTRSLLRRGLWLDGFVEYPTGRLSGWVAANGPFIGVRIGLDGKVRVGSLEGDVERTLFSGPLALVLGQAGRIVQSVNGGLKWQEVELPAQFEELFERASAVKAPAERGCSAVGCAFGPWVRIGWSRSEDEHDVLAPEPPPETTYPSSGGGRWLLQCRATGEIGGPRHAVRAARTAPARPAPRRRPVARAASGASGSTDEPAAAAWTDFQGSPAPRKHASEIGFETDTDHLDVQVHGWVWGVQGADWARVGRWQLAVSDAFAVKGAVWTTAVSRCPWPDTQSAARAFGRDSPANWLVGLEPSGTAGALLINSPGGSELFLFEQGRSIVPVRDAAKWEISNLAGIVKAQGSWFIGSAGPSGFRLFHVEADQISLVRYYPTMSAQRYGSRLVSSVVRSDRGDAIGVWVRDARVRGAETRWFIFPIDAETGSADEPLLVRPDELAQLPPPCSEGAEGWLLEGSPPVAPYVDLVGIDSVRDPRRVHARLLAGPWGLCTELLAAQAQSSLPQRLAVGEELGEPGRPSVPMALSEQGRTGRRWGFRCTR